MMPKRSNTRRPRKNGKTSGGRLSTSTGLARLTDSSSYKGQQHCTLKLTGTSSLWSTTVTTGVITQTYAVSTAAITSFASRFGNTFDEYRILGVRMRVRPVSPATGVSAMWFDEKNTGAPTLVQAQERTLTLSPNTNASSQGIITHMWRARDLLDLQYTAIATVVQPVTFKLYTDNANYGAPTAATAVWLVEPVFDVEFRGISAV